MNPFPIDFSTDFFSSITNEEAEQYNLFLLGDENPNALTEHLIVKTNNTINTNNEDSTEFAPIACDDCRVNHRRCDRIKPSCHGCTLRGLTCKYSTNYKRRAKISPNNGIKHEDVKILDFYFDGFNVIERRELEKFLVIHSKSKNTANYNKEKNEMAAFYYSMKAVCECQMGNIEKSDKSSRKAKEYLSKVFDSHSSILVGFTYLHLCSYELWFERLDSSKFYFQILLFYKESLTSVENSVGKEILISIIKILESETFNVHQKMDLYPLSFERFLEIIPDIFSFPEDDCKDFNNSFHILRHPHLINSSNCMEVNTFAQTIISECKNYEDETFGKSDAMSTFYKLVRNAVTLGILSKYAIITPMVEYTMDKCAKTIVKLIDNPNIILQPLEILTHISVAANYHFKKCTNQQTSELSKDSTTKYEEMLKIELNTYKLFASRFKIVKFYYYERVFKSIDEYFQLKQTDQ